MDDIRFDALARCLGSRRSLLAGVAVALSAAPVSVAARKGRKKKDKKPKKCQPGFTRCAGSTGKSTCVELQTDTTHCGACGKACPSNQTCVAGVCTSLCGQCGTGEVCCGGRCLTGECCNNADCGTEATCTNGKCKVTCNAGFTARESEGVDQEPPRRRGISRSSPGAGWSNAPSPGSGAGGA